MNLTEALPFLEQNHTAMVSTVTATGSTHATVVSAGLCEGQVAFVSRGDTVKVKNALKRGRAAVTVLRNSDNRYVTVEGSAVVHGWGNTSRHELLSLLRKAYTAVGRLPERWKDFDGAMEKEQRTVVLVSPERVYGSLERNS